MKLKKLLLSSMLVATATITLASCSSKKPAKTETTTPGTDTTPVVPTDTVVPTEKDKIDELEELDVTEAIAEVQNWLVDNYLNIYHNEKNYDDGKLSEESNVKINISYENLLKAVYERTAENSTGYKSIEVMRVFNAIAENVKSSSGRKSTDPKIDIVEASNEYDISTLADSVVDEPIEAYAKDLLSYLLTHDVLEELKNSDINNYKNAFLEIIKPYITVDETTNLPYVDPSKASDKASEVLNLQTILDLFIPLQEKGFFKLVVDSETMAISFNLDTEKIVEYLTAKQEAGASYANVITDIYGDGFINSLTELLSESNSEAINKYTRLVLEVVSGMVDSDLVESLEENFDVNTVFDLLNSKINVDKITPLLAQIDMNFGTSSEGKYNAFAKFPMPMEDDMVPVGLFAEYDTQTKEFHAIVAPVSKSTDPETGKVSYTPITEAALGKVDFVNGDAEANYVWNLNVTSSMLMQLFGPMFEGSTGFELTYSKADLALDPSALTPALSLATPVGDAAVLEAYVETYDLFAVGGEENQPIASFSILHNGEDIEYQFDVMGGMFTAALSKDGLEATVYTEKGKYDYTLVFEDEATEEYDKALIFTEKRYDDKDVLTSDTTAQLYTKDNLVGLDINIAQSEMVYKKVSCALEYNTNSVKVNYDTENSYKSSETEYKKETSNSVAELTYEDSVLSFDFSEKINNVQAVETTATANIAEKKLEVETKDYNNKGKLVTETYTLIEISNDGAAKKELADKFDEVFEANGENGIGKSFTELYEDASFTKAYSFDGQTPTTNSPKFENGVLTGSATVITSDYRRQVKYLASIDYEISNDTVFNYDVDFYGKKTVVSLVCPKTVNVTDVFSYDYFDKDKQYSLAYNYETQTAYIVDKDYKVVASYDGAMDASLVKALLEGFAEAAEIKKDIVQATASSENFKISFTKDLTA